LENFPKSEWLILWLNLNFCQLLDFLPMPIFHSIFSQSNHQRKIRLKLLHFSSDFLTDWYNCIHSLIFKITICCNNRSYALFNEFFSSIGINLFKWTIHPCINIFIPTMNNTPKSVVWCKLFCDCLNTWIICRFKGKKHLSRVKATWFLS